MREEMEALVKELEGCPHQGLVELAKDYLDALSEWSPDVQEQGREILKRAVEELKESLTIWRITTTLLESKETVEYLHKTEESANDHWDKLSVDPSISFVGMVKGTLLP